MSTYPKAPRSPHTSPITGAIAEELGWTPQSSFGMAHPTRSIRTPTLLPPLDTKSRRSALAEASRSPTTSGGGVAGRGCLLASHRTLVEPAKEGVSEHIR